MSSHVTARWVVTATLATSAFAFGAHTWAQSAPQKAATKPVQTDLESIAEEAYVYGYPLVIMEATLRATTNVAAPDAAQHAPPNQFVHVKRLPDDTFTTVVLPNVDTLYSTAFLDLAKEPMVLHVPDMKGRYYLMPMLDAYTNVFASPGTRTRGDKELNVAVVGPHWKGTLPKGLERIDAPTNLVWLLGRTQIHDKEDLPKVSALVDSYSLTPLSAYGKPYTPPPNPNVDPSIDMNIPPPQAVMALGDAGFFQRLAQLLEKNPPPVRDAEVLAQLETLGLTPGKFAPSAAATKAIQGVSERATKRIRKRGLALGRKANHWNIDTALGEYGTRYEDRAAVALMALGANLPQDAVYPAVVTDADGRKLEGKHNYVLHFEKGQEPPANAFWSLTMYGPNLYLVKNPIQRFAVGSRDTLKRNADGSLDLYIQHERPGADRLANWLPAPEGPFQMLLRMYWPKDSVLNGTWVPPAVQRVAR